MLCLLCLNKTPCHTIIYPWSGTITFYRPEHYTTTRHCDKLYCQKCPIKYSLMFCTTFYRTHHHTSTSHQMVTKYTLQNLLTMVAFFRGTTSAERIRESSEILSWLSQQAWYITCIQLGYNAWAPVCHHLFQSNQPSFVSCQDRCQACHQAST
jgi:hypothetical protein